MFLPREHLIGASRAIDKRVLESAKVDVEELAQRAMREDVARLLVRHKIERNVREYTIEYRLQVYVLTADELAKLVREAAFDLFRYGPRELPIAGAE